MKLSQKGIILVLVPVAFEFVFVGALFNMLAQSQQQVERANKARQVAAHLNKIQRLMMVIAGGLPVHLNGSEVKGPLRNQLTRRRVKEEFTRLRESAKGDAELLASADKMENSISESMFITADIKNVWVLMERLKSAKEKAKGHGLLDGLMHEIEIMWGQVDKIERDAPFWQAENRERIKTILLLGLSINIAIAIGLAFYFNRDTVSRLSRVMENARNIAERRELNKPLSGNDEIAMLDKAFTTMANTRDQFAEKEKALLVHASDVICSLDADGRIKDISPACEKLWGFEQAELLSSRLDNIVVLDDVSSTAEHIEKAKTHSETSFENRIARKGGGLVDMLWSMKWSPEEQTFFCVAHDNTERKTTERMKADFVSMLSHDLRSPLNSVQAFFTMISDKVYGSLNEKGMAKAASLESTISWLIEMISDLLDLDKIEAGLSDLNLKNVSLRKIAARAEEALDTLAEQEQVEIDLPVNDAIVFVDEDMFLRVVTNLVSNAIKFSPKGSLVKVEIEELDGQIELRIIDRGYGVKTGDQEVIFERFRQVGDAKFREKRSSGLGLAVSKAIVEQHGGTIGVRSVPGEGSTFWVRLPSEERTDMEVAK